MPEFFWFPAIAHVASSLPAGRQASHSSSLYRRAPVTRSIIKVYMQQSTAKAHTQDSAGNSGISVQFTNAGKRFNREWIFRRLNYMFSPGVSCAITGPNGSGKSTLLQCIAGSTQLSEGTVTWTNDNTVLPVDDVFRHITIVTPYLELIEEMTMVELLRFHASFKPLVNGVTPETIPALLGLTAAANKQIRFYSSGMKQRVKLAQAIFSDVPLLLLDEPCTNLDAPGYALYHNLVRDYCGQRTIIVSSNDPNEYSFCIEQLNITGFK